MYEQTLNLQKNPEEWVKRKAMPAVMAGLSPYGWFNLAYVALAAAFILLVRRHVLRPIPLLTTSWLARGQALYLLLLWWMVVGNFERAVVSFAPQRLVTEGVIFLNAVVCTVLVLWYGDSEPYPVTDSEQDFRPLVRRTAALGICALIGSSVLFWGIARLAYGDQKAPYAYLHIRFGPDATATKAKPKKGQPHP